MLARDKPEVPANGTPLGLRVLFECGVLGFVQVSACENGFVHDIVG